MIRIKFLISRNICSIIIIFAILYILFVPTKINAQNALILNGAYIVENGGTATNNIHIVINQPDTLGIVKLSNGGHIHSENQYNFVTWYTASNTGSFVFPFGVGGNSTDSIPFTFNKTAGNNTVSISTWTTDQQNNPKPELTNVAAVSHMNGITDSVLYAIDRFWDIQAPATIADLTFSYRASENTTITPTDLIKAQHWNGSSWDAPIGPGTNGVTSGIGTAGPFTGQNTFSPWVLITPTCADTVTLYPTICQGDNFLVGSSNYIVSGTYVDTLINSLGCDSIITTNLTVNPTFINNVSATICQGESILLEGAYQTTPGTYNDTIFGGNIYGCDSIVITNLKVSPTSINNVSATICQGESILLEGAYQTTPGIYNDTIFGGNVYGCDSIVITNLTILSNPQVNLIKTDDNCSENSGSVIADVISGNTPITYIWNTGSRDSFINNLSAGMYSVTVTDINGCYDSDSVFLNDLEEDCDYFVYLPNVFSPNGDGNNDVFYVRGTGIETITLRIFNRWGNQVFESNNLNEGWDGTYKGTIQNTSVFVYMLEVTFINGKTITKAGDISIIR